MTTTSGFNNLLLEFSSMGKVISFFSNVAYNLTACIYLVGMFSGVYNLQKSLGDLFNQNLLPGEDTYVKDISPIFSLGDKEQLDLQGDMNRDDKGTKERGGHGNEIEYHFSATELVPKWSSSSLPESLPPEISGGEEQWQPGYGGAIDCEFHRMEVWGMN
jgi:hypothetical protein